MASNKPPPPTETPVEIRPGGDVGVTHRGGGLQRICRVCGCTDDSACVGGCSWVTEDLCTACYGAGDAIRTLDVHLTVVLARARRLYVGLRDVVRLCEDDKILEAWHLLEQCSDDEIALFGHANASSAVARTQFQVPP